MILVNKKKKTSLVWGPKMSLAQGPEFSYIRHCVWIIKN